MRSGKGEAELGAPDLDPKLVKDLSNRLKRVEGQARGLQKMLEEGRSCEEILTQLSAMRSAIGTIATMLLVENLQSCFLQGDFESNEALARAKKLFAGFIR